jgi:spore germination protein YaaH
MEKSGSKLRGSTLNRIIKFIIIGFLLLLIGFLTYIILKETHLNRLVVNEKDQISDAKKTNENSKHNENRISTALHNKVFSKNLSNFMKSNSGERTFSEKLIFLPIDTLKKILTLLTLNKGFLELTPVNGNYSYAYNEAISYSSLNALPKNISNGITLSDGGAIHYPNNTTGDYLNKRREHIERKPDTQYNMKTSVWLDISNTSINKFIDVADYFNHVHPFLYDISGSIYNSSHVRVKRNSKAVYRMINKIKEKNPNILIIPTIFRWETSGRREINQVIGYGKGGETIMKEHIKSLIERTEKFDFDGIDIDYEGMHRKKEKYFLDFIKELRKEIDKYNKKHNKNIVLSLSLHPKTWASDIVRNACISHMGFQGDHNLPEVEQAKKEFSEYPDDTTFKTVKYMTVGKWKSLDFNDRTSFCKLYEYTEQWRGPQTHDYYDLNKYTDYIKIMAYEKFPMYGVPGPGPQAPLDWVEGITEYVYDHIPKEKVYVGLPTYGYQRPVGGISSGATTAVFWDTFESMSSKYEFPTNIYRPNDPNWKHYNILKRYNPKGIHSINGKAIKYYEPAIWYEKNGSYRVAFSINGEAYKMKIDEVRRYPVEGFSMWQFVWRNDKNIVEEIKKLVGKPKIINYDEFIE